MRDVQVSTTTPFIGTRLAIFMFGHYFGIGAWFVPLGVYMSKVLGFDSIIGSAYGMYGLATILSALFAGVIADRLFAAQRMVGVLQIGGGVILLALAHVTQTRTVLLTGLLLHFACVAAVAPLTVSIAFAHLQDPQRRFPSVRACGTLGWVVAGLIIGLWHGAAMTLQPWLLAGVVQIAFGLYAFTLPQTPPKARGEPLNIAGLFGLDILRGSRDRLLWVLLACLLVISIPKKFYDSFLTMFLVERGVELHAFGLTLEATGVQTLGQMVEALTLLALPWVIGRIGIKWVMVVGMVAWIVRFALFALAFKDAGGARWMILLGIMMHGLCYDFFFVSSQIWFDKRFDPSQRNRAQALYWFVVAGIGDVLGANIAGSVFAHWAVSPLQKDWTAIWLTPSFVTMAALMGFLVLFRQPKPASTPAQIPS